MLQSFNRFRTLGVKSDCIFFQIFMQTQISTRIYILKNPLTDSRTNSLLNFREREKSSNIQMWNDEFFLFLKSLTTVEGEVKWVGYSSVPQIGLWVWVLYKLREELFDNWRFEVVRFIDHSSLSRRARRFCLLLSEFQVIPPF